MSAQDRLQLRSRPQNPFERVSHHAEAIARDLDNFAHGTSAQADRQSCPNVTLAAYYTHFHGSAVFRYHHLRNHSPVREIDELDLLCRLMQAEMMRQVDIRQVGTHQLVFIIGRRQQYSVAYLLSLGVGPLPCRCDSKVFPAHIHPEWHRSALHSLSRNSWAIGFHVHSTKKEANNLSEMGHGLALHELGSHLDGNKQVSRS